MMVQKEYFELIKLLARQAVKSHLTGKTQQPCGSSPDRSNRPVQTELSSR